MSAPHAPPSHHYVIAFTVATALVYAGVGLFKHKSGVQRLVRIGGDLGTAAVPRLLSLLTFVAGALLLFSGATPAVGRRLEWLYHVLPIPVVELSHFFDNLLGAGLLILARGIERRLDVAYHLTIGVLAAATIFSLGRALDYEQSFLLAIVLVLFLPARKYFTRKTSLIEERFTQRWIGAIALVVVASTMLGFIAYQKLQIRADLLYSPRSEEARFLRSTAGLLGILIIAAIFRLVRPVRISAPVPTSKDIADATALLATSPDASSQLALLGDKHFLFNASRTGMIQYGLAGRSLVSLGDPIAPVREVPDMIEMFVRRATDQGLFPVFYKIGPVMLHLYLDYGLTVVKLGEEAHVPLADFSLDGPERRNLRRVWRKMIDAGLSVEIVQPESVSPILSELRAISDRWLEIKRSREKGFSLGFFSDDYVTQHPVAIARQNGKIVAFANIWRSGFNEELEVDLMRYLPDAPQGLMRYVLVEVMLWGRAQGYRAFSLGMAPLSGLREKTGAPVWHQLGNAVRGYGERFYNFQGIRDFKEWFHPEWEPRFLVSPGGTARPVVLANIASLIAGGLGGVIGK